MGSLFIALLLLAVAVIIVSTPCCGDNWSYDENSWKEKCQELSNNTIFENNESHSCYHRNISALVTGLFSLLLMIIGTIVIICGECLYDVTEEKEDEALANY